MSENGSQPEQPIETEEIEIDGVAYEVPVAIVKEMECLADGLVDRIRSFRPQPGDTIVVTTPAGASQDFFNMVVNQVAKQFPEFRATVMPETLGLHTASGLAEVLSAGCEMAHAWEDEEPLRFADAVERWNALMGAREDAAEEAPES